MNLDGEAWVTIPMAGSFYSENEVGFNFCIHKDRYPIKSEQFLNYLTTDCKGFTVSEDGKYSVHYLLVVLLTNWKDQHLISRCKVKTNKQIRRVFGIRGSKVQIYHLRLNIFLLLDTPLKGDFYFFLEIRKRTEACTEADREAELVGGMQQGHSGCSEHNCISTLDCCGYLACYFPDDEIIFSFETPNSTLLWIAGS